MQCELFEYSSERIDTGIASIDSVEDSLSTDTMNFQFTLELYIVPCQYNSWFIFFQPTFPKTF